MIVDCHTHIWQSPDQLGQLDLGDSWQVGRPRAPRVPTAGKSQWRSVPAADPEHHWAQTSLVDKSIVLGFKSKYLRAEIPNAYVAEYVNRFPQKLIVIRLLHNEIIVSCACRLPAQAGPLSSMDRAAPS